MSSIYWQRLKPLGSSGTAVPISASPSRNLDGESVPREVLFLSSPWNLCWHSLILFSRRNIILFPSILCASFDFEHWSVRLRACSAGNVVGWYDTLFLGLEHQIRSTETDRSYHGNSLSTACTPPSSPPRSERELQTGQSPGAHAASELVSPASTGAGRFY
ncbi:uncharacterized protein EI97DRAFT_322444 [Westerdykella ornata]|uniref:Uncharacterized protein n=1 Tax=Westerdykella ornata TaxID=318751 RepID=A0A6A6JJX7_WESOR|nr:uncharacterized protein EI97DRAFT_322444 [Westerdykella ornata]KAF2276807.1 hypothetical protein EI97DRAFT_322444 [Westerdykella ornata]